MRCERYLNTNYIIYEDGRIFNEKLNRFVVQRLDKDGYLVCWMNINNKRICVKVHRIVAEVFIPNPLNKPQVNHKDLNKANPHISNLEWNEQDENITHSFNNTNRHKKPVVRSDGIIFSSIADAARSMNISKTLIQRCVSSKQNKAGGYEWRYYNGYNN